MEVQAKLIKGNRKHDLLQVGGYLFERNKIISTGTSYRCLKYKFCPARVHRGLAGTLQFGEHSHPPGSNAIKAREVLTKGKELAISSRTLHSGQIMEEMEKICEEINCPVSSLGSSNAVKRKLTDVRQKTFGKFSLGQTLQELDITADLRLTTGGQPFMIYDNQAGANLMIIFASTYGLDKLSYCQTWLIDGTFKSCPSLFSQIYTIHGVYSNVASLPFVYGYLTSKSQEHYIEFFETVCRRTTGGPAHVISDFEISAINACRHVFPGTELRGCLFHLAQSIFRKVQSKPEILARYINDDEDGLKVRKMIRSIGALAFLPVNEVMNAFLEIRNQFRPTDPVREVFSYFQDTYLGFTWNDVLFPIEFWNVYDQFREGIYNSKEGWHFRFNSLSGRAHPTMASSIETIRSEERHTQDECEKNRAGYIPGKKKASNRIEKRLRVIMQNRDNQLYTGYLDFLGAIQSCLHDFIQF